MAVYRYHDKSWDNLVKSIDMTVRVTASVGLIAIILGPILQHDIASASNPIPTEPPGVPLDSCYAVKLGDTLTGIGAQMNPPQTWEGLWQINSLRSELKSPDNLKPGNHVALIPGACNEEDLKGYGIPLVNNSEQGMTDVRGNAYELTVTTREETISSVANRLNVNPTSILALNPAIDRSVGVLPEATLVIVPASQKARLESAILKSEQTLPKGSWQPAGNIFEIRGSDFGTEGTNHIMSALEGRKVQAVLFEKESGKAIRKDGSITGVYEDAQYQGHFIVGFRTTLGNEVFLSLGSLLIKIE